MRQLSRTFNVAFGLLVFARPVPPGEAARFMFPAAILFRGGGLPSPIALSERSASMQELATRLPLLLRRPAQ